MISHEVLFFTVFLLFLLGMLLLDLGIFSKQSHIVSFKEATIWSIIWVGLSIGFYFIVKYHADWIHQIQDFEHLQGLVNRYARGEIQLNPALPLEDNLYIYRNHIAKEYLEGYLIEYTLSADNIFVMILIFSSFGVKEKYFKKVLFWGVIGAIVMRFLFIFLGYELIKISDIKVPMFGQEIEFNIVLIGFGVFLIYAGVKSFFEGDEDEKIEPQKHPVVRFASKYFAVYPRYIRDKFFVRKKSKIMLTPLFIVVLIVEFTDLLFAVDSVPAVFSVSQDPYIVFFSNIFAIMGLRSMFFFLSNIMHLFHYLKVGLGVLLSFIGFKMVFAHFIKAWGVDGYSIYIIFAILVISIVASLLFPKKEEEPNPDRQIAETEV